MSTIKTLAIAALAAWLLFAATPQPSRHQHVYQVTPVCDAGIGICTLPDAPNPPASLRLHMNGIRQKPGEDYVLGGLVITPVAANVALYSDPATIVVADYDR